MKTYIYFVRHGEVTNLQKIWYGRLPFYHLSEKGKLQIQNTAKYLQDKQINVIYSSPLLRARQTAEILKKELRIPIIHFSKKLLEVKSSLQGSLDEYLLSINYDFYASGKKKITGETIEQVSERMKAFIKKVAKLHKGKNVVAVSHGDPIMVAKLQENNLSLTVNSLRQKGKAIKLGGIYLLKI